MLRRRRCDNLNCAVPNHAAHACILYMDNGRFVSNGAQGQVGRIWQKYAYSLINNHAKYMQTELEHGATYVP